jgi:Fur family transcriptional regulator, ferric uptake regulator
MRTRRGAQTGTPARPQARTAKETLPEIWRERFRAGKVKATTNRLRVMGRFLRSDASWTLQSLHKALNQDGRCDLSSVYRALSDLRIAGILEEFRLPGTRETFYALLGHDALRKSGRHADGGKDHHHHHIVCEDCGRVSHLEVCLPAVLTVKVEGTSGFRVTGHHLEFQGLCAECR